MANFIDEAEKKAKKRKSERNIEKKKKEQMKIKQKNAYKESLEMFNRIVELYSSCDSDYIEKDGVVIIKSSSGNICGKVDGKYFYSKRMWPCVSKITGSVHKEDVIIFVDKPNVECYVDDLDEETKSLYCMSLQNVVILKNGKRGSVYSVCEPYEYFVFNGQSSIEETKEQFIERHKDITNDMFSKLIFDKIDRRIEKKRLNKGKKN